MISGDVQPKPDTGKKKPPMNRQRLVRFYSLLGAKVDKMGHVTWEP
jgi:hypothetical protein